MLQHLHIENYALIDRLEIEFRPGFNLLTGETGSGKSIVVDAVGLLLGDKASSETIRSGAERGRISGIFSLETSASLNAPTSPRKSLAQLLTNSGIEVSDGEELILQRDILSGGRSRVFVNNQPATVGLFKSMAPFLAEVHGQNEQQELFLPSTQLELLDRFGSLTRLAATVQERFELWKDLRRRQEDLVRHKQERQRQMEMWQFQKREIEQAGVVAGEDQRLEEEKRLLAHAAEIHSRLAAAYDLLYDSAHAAVSSLAAAHRNLEEVSSYDATVKPLAETLLSARVSMEDVALSLRDRLSRLDMSPGRLEEVETRLALLDRLKRKYGPTLEEVLRSWAGVCRQVAETESSEALSQELETKQRQAGEAYQTAAEELSRGRAKAAKDLKAEVEKELKALAMQGTVFEARLASAAAEEEWRAFGIDRVEFLISPNPGEPLRPLARIASGGETSRVMLALETAIDARRSAGAADHTLIFDEVDAGIGGQAAETVGRKLRQLGERRQILCVTHLPQIASFAHHHFRVEKSEQGGRTVTRVQYLEGAARTDELARMLSGSQITEAVRKHAAQLLKLNS